MALMPVVDDLTAAVTRGGCTVHIPEAVRSRRPTQNLARSHAWARRIGHELVIVRVTVEVTDRGVLIQDVVTIAPTEACVASTDGPLQHIEPVPAMNVQKVPVVLQRVPARDPAIVRRMRRVARRLYKISAVVTGCRSRPEQSPLLIAAAPC